MCCTDARMKRHSLNIVAHDVIRPPSIQEDAVLGESLNNPKVCIQFLRASATTSGTVSVPGLVPAWPSSELELELEVHRKLELL